MEESLQILLTPEMLILVPIVGALLQIIKKISVLNKIKEWFPYISIGIALALGKLSGMEDPIIPSVIIGLVASGSYDLLHASTKKTLAK